MGYVHCRSPDSEDYSTVDDEKITVALSDALKGSNSNEKVNYLILICEIIIHCFFHRIIL